MLNHIINLNLAPRMCSAFPQVSVVSVGMCPPQDRQCIRDRMAEPAQVPIFSNTLVDFNLRQHISFSSCTRETILHVHLVFQDDRSFTDLSPFWLYCHKGHNMFSLHHILCNSNTETQGWIIVSLMLILPTLGTLILWMSISVIFSLIK